MAAAGLVVASLVLTEGKLPSQHVFAQVCKDVGFWYEHELRRSPHGDVEECLAALHEAAPLRIICVLDGVEKPPDPRESFATPLEVVRLVKRCALVQFPNGRTALVVRRRGAAPRFRLYAQADGAPVVVNKLSAAATSTELARLCGDSEKLCALSAWYVTNAAKRAETARSCA